MRQRAIRRRGVLKLLGSATAMSILVSACGGGQATPSTTAPGQAQPTPAPSKDQEPAKPAAAATKPAPAATTAPQAPVGAPVPALLRSGDGEEDYFNRAIDLFEKQNPTVKITRVFVPGGNEYTTKLDLMIAAGDPPAIYAPFSDRGYRYYASRGLSQELDDFVARDKVDLKDFHEDGLKGCYWKGKLSALPLDLWPHVTFINRNLFEEAGVASPTTDFADTEWTTEVYEELAAKLTKKSGDEVTQFGSDVYQKGFPAAWSHGGWLFPEDTYSNGVCAEYVGDQDPRVVSGLQWSADLINKHHYSPTPAQQQQVMAGAPVLFMSGKVAMGVSNIGRLSRYATIKDFDWGLGATPQPPKGEKRHQHVWIDMWSMIKGVKNLDGSWQFLKFMVSAEAQKIYPIEYGPLSSLRSLAGYWADFRKSQHPNLTDAEWKCIQEAPQHEQIDPENWTTNFTVIYSQVLSPAIDKIFLGEQTAEEAIKESAPKIRKIIDETKNIGA